VQLRAVEHDLHRATAEHVAGSDHHRIADALRNRLGLLGRTRNAVFRLPQPELVKQLLKTFTVLGNVDRVGRGAENRNPGRRQCLAEFQWCLSAILHDAAKHAAVLLFTSNQCDHLLGGQRFEIQTVRRVVIGADRLGIAVHHDGLKPGVAERVSRVYTAVIEFDALADPVRAAAKDDDLVAAGGVGFADRRAPATLVGRIHVGRGRREFAGAGVNAFIHRMNAKFVACCGDLGLGLPGQLGQALVGEPHRLQPPQRTGFVRQAAGGDTAFRRYDLFQLAQVPRVEFAGIVDVLDRQPSAQSLCRHQDPIRPRGRQRGAERIRSAVARRLDLVQAREPRLGAAQAFL